MAALRRLASTIRISANAFQGTRSNPIFRAVETGKNSSSGATKCRFFSSDNPGSSTPASEKDESRVQKYVSYLKTNAEAFEFLDVNSDPTKTHAFKKAMEIWKSNLSKEEMDECLKAVAISMSSSDPRLANMYLNLAQLFHSQDAHDKALSCCKKAMEVLQDKNSPDFGFCLYLAASIHKKLGDHDSVIREIQKMAEIFVESSDERVQPLIMEINFMLAAAMSAQGRHDEAVKPLKAAIAIQEKKVGEKSFELGDSYLKLAEALAQSSRVDEGVEFCEKALKIHGGKFSVAEAATRRLLAILFKGMNENGKAVEQNKQVKEILLKQGRVKEARLMDIGIAVCKIKLGEYRDAVEILHSIISEEKEGEEDPGLLKGLAHGNLAKICLLNDMTDDAATHGEKAMGVFRKNKSRNTVVAEGFGELASVFEALRDFETAAELFEEAVKIYADVPGQRNAVAGAQAQLGRMFLMMERYRDAVTHLSRSVKILEVSPGKESQAYGSVMNHLGFAYMSMKKMVLAAEYFEKAKLACMKAYGAGDENTLAVNHNLVLVYAALRRWDKAIGYQSETLKELESQNAGGDRMEKEREMMKKLESGLVTQSV